MLTLQPSAHGSRKLGEREMVWVYYLILIALLVAGWLINIVTLPGLWLMAGSLAFYGWWTGWNVYVGWHSVIAMLALAAVGEVVELSAGATGSRLAGARRRGMIGSLIGSIIGAICFTGLVPIPIVGTIIGVCLGAFLGAAIAELSNKGVRHSLAVGFGAAGGRLAGILAKLGFGFVMFFIGAAAAFPIGGRRLTPAVIIPAARSLTSSTNSVASTSHAVTMPTSVP